MVIFGIVIMKVDLIKIDLAWALGVWTSVAKQDLDPQGSLTLTLKFKFVSSQGKNFWVSSNSSQGLKS